THPSAAGAPAAAGGFAPKVGSETGSRSAARASTGPAGSGAGMPRRVIAAMASRRSSRTSAKDGSGGPGAGGGAAAGGLLVGALGGGSLPRRLLGRRRVALRHDQRRPGTALARRPARPERLDLVALGQGRVAATPLLAWALRDWAGAALSARSRRPP